MKTEDIDTVYKEGLRYFAECNIIDSNNTVQADVRLKTTLAHEEAGAERPPELKHTLRMKGMREHDYFYRTLCLPSQRRARTYIHCQVQDLFSFVC